MTSVVQQNDLVFEFASNVMEDEHQMAASRDGKAAAIVEQGRRSWEPWQLGDPSIFPAVIVEHVPSADLLHSYSGLACVDDPNDMITESSLDVAEEQIIDDDDDDITLTGLGLSIFDMERAPLKFCIVCLRKMAFSDKQD